VALIRGALGSGTGFLVRPDRLVTNAHVIRLEPLDRLRVQFPGRSDGSDEERTIKALLYEDRRRDLAVLAIEPAGPGLAVPEAYHVDPGQAITVIGYPGVGRHPLRINPTGTMSDPTTLEDGREFNSLSVPSINPGHSGSPVFDSRGQVIGVITAVPTQQTAIAYAMPLEALRNAIRKAGAQSPSGCARLKAEHDCTAVFYVLAQPGQGYAAILRHYAALAERAPQLATVAASNFRVEPDEATVTAIRSDGVLKADIRSVYSRVLRDSRVDQAARDQLAELWTTYNDMRTSVAAPSGTLKSFAAKARQLTGKYDRLVAAFKSRLGVERLD
jgi:hypothetical protein